MNKWKQWTSFLVLCLCLSLFAGTTAHAAVTEFPDLYLELTTEDDIIILTPDTLSGDPAWKSAGITDVSAEKKDMKKRNGYAILYDPKTQTKVQLLCKSSEESINIFNLSEASTQAKKTFYDTLLTPNTESGKDGAPEINVTVDEIPGDMTFFRMEAKIGGEQPMTEVLYSTIYNGLLLSFDTYTKTPTIPIDETLQKSLMNSIHITKVMTRAEYDKLQRESMIRSLIFLAAIVLMTVGLILYSKKKRKNLEEKKQNKSNAMLNYYTKKKEQEGSGLKQSLIAENTTTYTQELISQFCHYTNYARRWKFWVYTGCLYIILLLLIFMKNGLNLTFLLVAVIMLVILCVQYFRVEKQVDFLWKPYASSNSKTAQFHFYEDHVTMTGINGYTDYPYMQITDVQEYKNFVYLYLATDRGLYLSKDGFTKDYKEVMEYIRAYLNSTQR